MTSEKENPFREIKRNYSVFCNAIKKNKEIIYKKMAFSGIYF